LDRQKLWEFTPAEIKVDDIVSGGDIIGFVKENNLIKHRLMVPPRAAGVVTKIARAGSFKAGDSIYSLEFEGKETAYDMVHSWPVRVPRPTTEKLAGDTPLLTGQRVLDALFP
jgi:V-type H+-transporting ATPase subunit A